MDSKGEGVGFGALLSASAPFSTTPSIVEGVFCCRGLLPRPASGRQRASLPSSLNPFWRVRASSTSLGHARQGCAPGADSWCALRSASPSILTRNSPDSLWVSGEDETTSASSPRSLSPRLGDGCPDGGADHRRWRELGEGCADRFLSYQFRDLAKSIQRVPVPVILSGAKRPRLLRPLLDVQHLLGPMAREDRQLVLSGGTPRPAPLGRSLLPASRPAAPSQRGPSHERPAGKPSLP